MRHLVSGLVVVAVLATGCGDDGADPPDTVIEVFGPYRGAEADRFAEVLDGAELPDGVAVRYVGSIDFVADLRQRVGEGADPPDLAVVPQLGVVRRLVEDGDLVPLAPEVRDAVLEDYGARRAALGEVDGTLYAVPFRVTLKSLVWYPPAVFAEHGWEAPGTLDELEELVSAIEAEPDLVPWCFGIEAGSATGWAATDWVEELVLRRAGPQRYAAWATGEVTFAAPDIQEAFAEFRSLVLAPGRVLGGSGGVVETAVDEVHEDQLVDPPRCVLHRQADFALDWMPEGTEVGPDGDIDWFVLPDDEPGDPPLLVGGDVVVQLRSDPAVDAVMAHLASAEAVAGWTGRGGFLSLNPTVPEDAYPTGHLRDLHATVTDASVLAYDASDQMPPEVGTDLLWEEVTAWVAGATTSAELAREIDAARDGEPPP